MRLNPVILLVKLPVPVPSEVWLSLVVGLADVLQQTPLAVMGAPPLEVTFPPLEAPLLVIEDMAVVVTVGTENGDSDWVTAKGFPAMVMVPVRGLVLEFAETE